MPTPSLIAITGGIGSGKSVVCSVLRALGYPVYDCDSRAKALMDADTEIKRRIAADINPSAIDANGCIDRKALSAIVFNDADKLAALNAIVHSAVRADLRAWKKTMPTDCSICFVETAILYQSGLDREVEAVWEVAAPVDVRIARVQKRSGLTAAEVRARIASQSFTPASPHPVTCPIINDGHTSLLRQIAALLRH
ncbi:MAG: dephospho-CoA kinase [Muribaculaceae bacterium]|nr:dephospho-CoA kinase [Muribaculaceae bacterium]